MNVRVRISNRKYPLSLGTFPMTFEPHGYRVAWDSSLPKEVAEKIGALSTWGHFRGEEKHGGKVYSWEWTA